MTSYEPARFPFLLIFMLAGSSVPVAGLLRRSRRNKDRPATGPRHLESVSCHEPEDGRKKTVAREIETGSDAV